MDKRIRRLFSLSLFLFFLAALLVGTSLGPGSWLVNSSAQQNKKPAEPAQTLSTANNKDHAPGTATTTAPKKTSAPRPEEMELTGKSPAAYDENWDREYPQDQRKKLLPFPELRPGDIPPVKLYLYGGPAKSSYASVDDVANFNEFYTRLSEQKPTVMARWKTYLDTRYSFSGKTDPTITMTRGKPLPVGPVVKLPEKVASWDHTKLGGKY